MNDEQVQMDYIDYRKEGSWVWSKIYLDGQGPLHYAPRANAKEGWVDVYVLVNRVGVLLRNPDSTPRLVRLTGDVRILKFTCTGKPFLSNMKESNDDD